MLAERIIFPGSFTELHHLLFGERFIATLVAFGFVFGGEDLSLVLS